MCKRKVTLKIDFENIDENYIHIFFKLLFYDIRQMICLVVFIFLLYLFNLLMFRHFSAHPCQYRYNDMHNTVPLRQVVPLSPVYTQ